MADTVSVEYLYPPNLLDEDWDDRAGNRKVIVHFKGVSDGTGETDVVKVDLSDLKTHNGVIPAKTAVESIQWHVNGCTVDLEWDRAPHASIFQINANGTEDNGKVCWENIGGRVDPGDDDLTGDILLTTTNVDSGDSYEITMCLRLKE